MNPENRLRYLRWAAVFAALLLVFCAWFPPLQQLADAQVDAGLKRALVTFASARTLNGLISVVQGTELSAQPFGVGLTLTVGQVLDPINDLIEQFSSLMLFASVAFGVQKMLLAIGGHWVVSSIVSVVAIAWAAAAITGRPRPWLTRLMLVLLMIRLAIPVATIGSDFVFERLMAREYQEHEALLKRTEVELKAMTPRTAPGSESSAEPPSPQQEQPGLVERFRKGVEEFRQGVGERLPNVDLEAIKQTAEELPERIIRLTVIFLMQTVALPLLLVWGLYALAFGAVPALAGGAGPAGPRSRPR